MLDSIPTFTEFKITLKNRDKCENLYVFSMIAMYCMNQVNPVGLKRVLDNYKYLIYEANGHKKLECFTTLEYALRLKEFSQIVNKAIVQDMVTNILSSDYSSEATVSDGQFLEKFIIVLIEMESLLPKSKTFPMTTSALQYFQSRMMTVQQCESGWPELLSKTLRVLQFCNDDNRAKHVIGELLEQIR